MRHGHTVEQVRAAERALMARLPEGALMRRAAAGLAGTCCRLLGRGGGRGGVYGTRTVLLVGGGDNGGDTLYAGAALARRGGRVTALLLVPERAHAGGLRAFRSAGGRFADDAGVLADADLVLDGITGIGGSGGLRPGAAELAVAAGRSPALVVAVDVPSGVDASTGEVAGAAVRADLTVTFGTEKVGLVMEPGSDHAGVVHLVDIGLGPYLPPPAVVVPRPDDVAALVPTPDAADDKYSRGVVGVVAGSDRYPGAAVLAVGGALHGGAGAVRYAGPAEVGRAVLARWPETLVTAGTAADAGRVQAWIAGPGLGTGDDGRERLAPVLAADVPVLLDADALTLVVEDGLDDLRARTAPTVLTPHAGEAARMLGAAREDVQARRLEHARRLAALTGAVVLLKGAGTIVLDADGAARVNPTGTPWLGTAGSGDVLSGLVGSLLACGLEAADAATAGAFLHGLAGRLAAGPGAPMGASDLVAALPGAWEILRRGAGPWEGRGGRHTPTGTTV